MGLVALGLVLIMARIALRQSNRWLVATNLGALGLTLYVCAYLDFSAMIARFNVDHSYELTGKGPPLDLWYLSRLGPTVLPALDDFIANVESTAPVREAEAREARWHIADDFEHRDRDWRSWNFRDWRAANYLAGQPEVARSLEDAIN
jgi:hypothetical protein